MSRSKSESESESVWDEVLALSSAVKAHSAAVIMSE
jgi:hypothetical protein